MTTLAVRTTIQLFSRPAAALAARVSTRSAGHKSPRIGSIDATRGAAMLFVCLAHFALAYLAPLNANGFSFLAVVGMIASPTFMTISGMTTGFLGATSPRSLPYLRRRLLDRGVFMLLVGHLLLALSFTIRGDKLSSAYRTGFITDPIAIAIMIGPRLVGDTKALVRAALSIWLFVLGWLLVWLWHPGSVLATGIKPYVVGSLEMDGPGARLITFPLLQWLAVYLIGTILGEHVGQIFRTEPHRAWRPFLRVGVASTTLGLLVYLGAKWIAAVHTAAVWNLSSLRLAAPTQKLPPGPVYLLFFGGAGLILMWFVLLMERRQLCAPIVRSLQHIGQASLVVYLLQGFVYAYIRRMELPYVVWWPLIYVASVLLLCVAAAVWCRIDGNRFLTVGITKLLESRARRSSSFPTNRPARQPA